MKRNKNSRKGNKAIERAERSKFGMYTGPIRVGESAWTDKLDVVNLHSVSTISSNGVGVMASEITFNPNTTAEWASFAARYLEYRVLAVLAEFHPRPIVNTTGVIGAPVVFATNKGGAFGTPSSRVQVFSLTNPKVGHSMKVMKYEIRPDDYTDLDVGSTGSPSSEFSLLLYSDSMTVSTTFYDVFFTWVVQFSSRQ